MAKDILKPHAIFWPSMLLALRLPLFRRLLIHGYWVRGEAKMSKSLGNVIRPLDMKQQFGIDTLRYFLLREMAFGQDASFNEDAFAARANADLANGLGNLASRVLSMQQRYFDGQVQPLDPPTAADDDLQGAFAQALVEVPEWTEQLAFHRALEALWRALDHANKYVVDTAPFTLARERQQLPRVGGILHRLLECLYTTATLLAWFLPETSQKIFSLLGVTAPVRLPTSLGWGEHFPIGHRVQPPITLFPRIDLQKEATPRA